VNELENMMTYLELNPYWNIPTIIAAEDLLPKIRKNPVYFEEQGIRVSENWEENAGELDSRTIDWSNVNANQFPYKLRQNPGPDRRQGAVEDTDLLSPASSGKIRGRTHLTGQA